MYAISILDDGSCFLDMSAGCASTEGTIKLMRIVKTINHSGALRHLDKNLIDNMPFTG